MENMLQRLSCFSSLFILHERIESNYSWKMALRFNKRTPFFDKRILGQSRGTSGSQIPPNWKLFLTHLLKIEKLFFSKKTLSTKPKIVPGLLFSFSIQVLNDKITEDRGHV